MGTASHSLDEVVRVAESVTDETIEGDIVSAIRAELDGKAKAQIVHLYDEDEIAEPVARRLLGDTAFDDAVEKARGAEMVLSGDPSRFLSSDD